MNKKLIITFTFILIILVSITLSFGDFFFTAQYYKDPLKAYNENCTYDIVYGETKATKQIGIQTLDEENCLFIGELNEQCFVVAEMSLKNGKYAFKGTSMLYDIKEGNDDMNTQNQTSILSGTVSWAIIYNESVLGSLLNIASINSYELSDGHTIYLVIYA